MLHLPKVEIALKNYLWWCIAFFVVGD